MRINKRLGRFKKSPKLDMLSLNLSYQFEEILQRLALIAYNTPLETSVGPTSNLSWDKWILVN